MSHVVVTGAAGFIGWHLTRQLADAGHVVQAVDIRPCPEGLSLPGVAYQRIDVQDTAALRAVVADAETVYHLASAHLDVRAGGDMYYRINVRASQALVRLCGESGVRRVVHASTVGIYGHVEHPPAREDTLPAPGNVYERTKLDGERAVRSAAAETGLELIVLRPAWVYGPRCSRTAKLLRSVKRGRFVYIGAGTNLRHPIYVSDAVSAFILASTAPAALSGQAYLVAGPRAMPLREVVEVCARTLGVPPPHRRLPRPLALAIGHTAELAWGAVRREPPFSRRSIAFFENDNAFDITAARRDLHFEPQVEFEEGVRRTIDDPAWPLAL